MDAKDAYLNDLNPRQREAAMATEGPLLILAGAGAGKTKTLTYRILRLIREGVSPSEVLAITFTNKAAKEMRERVGHLLGHDPAALPATNFGLRRDLPFVSTFHALGVYLIREEYAAVGVPKRFSIYDRSDSKAAVKAAMVDLGFDPKMHDPGKVLGAISRGKGDMLTPDSYAQHSKNRMAVVVAPVWRRYEEILAREKALDFDDLLFRAAHLLENDAAARARWQARWRYIHIDEYQDTNEVQYRIAKALAAKERHICAVGDTDQNIYSWRGATIKNIMAFERDYPDAKVVLLEQNYRSTQTILAAANQVISKNKNRHDKNLFTENGPGQKIVLKEALDEMGESRWVAEESAAAIRDGVSPSEIAVLYRANYQSRALEEAMLRAGIPYRVIGTRFFERREVKDAMSFLRAATSADDIACFRRAAAAVPRGLGPVTLLKALEGKDEELPPAGRAKVAAFRAILAEIGEAARTLVPSEAVKRALQLSGMEKMLREEGPEGEERLENVRELASLATKYDGLPPEEGMDRLLEDAALASDQDELEGAPEGVRLMTIHAAKGLEFERVFVVGLEQGLFPNMGFGDSDRDVEEERRLFYVALTRARKRLFLSRAMVRTVYGERRVSPASEFLADIDETLTEAADGDMDVSTGIKSYFIDF
jgi:DNA helicase-2/ATP-dependent DNA helicase PcrA